MEKIIGTVKRNPFATGGAPDHIQAQNYNNEIIDTFIPPDEYISEKIVDKKREKIAEFYYKKTKKIIGRYNHEYRLHIIDFSFERIILLALISVILGEKHSSYIHTLGPDESGYEPSIEFKGD